MCKKLSITLLICCIVAGSLYAALHITSNKPTTDKTAIIFIEQDWAKTTQTAKEQHKLIFLDLYATWCGPCRMLRKNTFSNKEVAALFNSNFINASIDVEKGIGITLAEKYNVSMLPTLVIADSEGNPILYTTGYMEPKELLSFAKAALDKMKK